MKPKPKDRVWLGDRRRACHVVSACTINGEAGVVVKTGVDKNGDLRTVRLPVADLVRDLGRGGWRERWRQQDMFNDQVKEA